MRRDPFDAAGPAAVVVARVANWCGSEVTATARLGGGDVAEAFRCDLADRTTVFAKTHRRPPPDFFDTEARGLSALESAGGRVPKVLGVDDRVLVLEWVEESRGAATTATETEFGVMLARLHRAPLTHFGRADHRTTGSRRLPNEPCATWPEFYATQRLVPLARLAADADALPADAIADLERMATRLDRLGAADEAPVQLHGDLWAGNRLIDTDARNWLIDPAAHGGHREFDLAMMRLFGGFGQDAFVAYAEESPLAAGWEERVPVHQLAPLAVHAIKFGGGYVGATRRALDDCRRLVG